MSTHSARADHKKTVPQPDHDAKLAMDQMYRWTRHIYDATRKYYLLGRDTLIENLNAQPGENVCEVGCGTGRNLRKMAAQYPRAWFYGLDASDEMLKTAEKSLKKKNISNLFKLKQGYAQNFSSFDLFGLEQPLDKIVFSYALSIIPPWRESIDHALTVLKNGGEIHIVDFGGQNGLPAPFRRFLFWWLKQFHVYHKPEILNYLQRLDLEKKGTLELRHLYKGYAYYAVFRKN
ncbi:MAG: methyltransferase domain-containing protein [Alphaproteobacteria bacterium]